MDYPTMKSFVMLFLFINMITSQMSAEDQYCTEGDATCSGNAGRGHYSGYSKCPELSDKAPNIDTEPQSWQNVTGGKLWVFSAFIERRVPAHGPAIRVVASGLQEQFNEVGDLHCILWYDRDNNVAPISHKAEYIRIYPSTYHPDMWVAHFIICPIELNNSDDPTPYAISVVSKPCDEPENFLLVLHREKVTKTPTHALCLPPIYMRFSDWVMVIEVIELHKMLGASEITVYNQTMSAEVNKVLNEYRNDPTFKVNVIEWHFPGHLVKNNVNCQRGALNDCLYRMSLRHQFVTITDLDEVLVPRVANTWPELMKVIATPKRGIFMFQHAYFRRNNTGQTPYLITQQSLWRTDRVFPEGKIRCKSMYNTTLALSIDLHYHYDLLPGAEEYLLPPDEGMLHHYRSTPMETFHKYPERFTFIEDDHMHKYGAELKRRVSNAIKRMQME
jgi:hypothetical protein